MTETKSKPFEFKNFLDFQGRNSVPQIMLYASKDSYEFDLIAERYKELIRNAAQPFEIVIYVSEPGDADKFFAEIFNFSMFATTKLFIIKSAQQFFKSIANLKKDQLENIPEEYLVLMHFDNNEIPAKILSLFGKNTGILKAKNYYPGETRQALEEILKMEKLTLDQDAFDEFIYKTHPSHGAYLKNIRKLQLYFNKKNFSHEDVQNVLSNDNDLNASYLVDLIFLNHEFDFFRELSKFRTESDNLLLFLSILLSRTNELRKYKVLVKQRQYNEELIFQMLGIQAYSEKRKRFVLSRMQKEARYFSDKAVETLYDILIDLGMKSKLNAGKNLMIYFVMRMTELFRILKRVS